MMHMKETVSTKPTQCTMNSRQEQHNEGNPERVLVVLVDSGLRAPVLSMMGNGQVFMPLPQELKGWVCCGASVPLQGA